MRIVIFGPPGSGKTVLGGLIASRLHLDLFHIDRLFFQKGWIERAPEAFHKDLGDILEKASWVLDGNAMASLERRFSVADVVIYYNRPRWRCLLRVLWRALKTFGREKRDGPDGSTNRVTWRLLCYTWRFKTRYASHVDMLREKYPHVRWISIASFGEKERVVEELLRDA